ncbi:MAG: leucyl aminopeptidase family protein [Mycoplasmataceae bacterium]|nr:leucyl aminopeptidase family protein [Mycoplasmataceae bacterium]
MKLVNRESSKSFSLKGLFESSKIKENNLIKTKFAITEFGDKKIAYIFLGKDSEFNKCLLKSAAKKIINSETRDFEIDAKSFVAGKVTEEMVVNMFVDQWEYIKGEGLYSAKTTKKQKDIPLAIFSSNAKMKSVVQDALLLAKSVNLARKLQATPPNICNSEWLASEMSKTLKNHGTKIKLKVLNKKEIEAEKMGLLLSVNAGSGYEARLVTAEYIGNPSSKNKTVYVGKGITFDTGGYNLKPSNAILGMKYDMSGAAICFAAFNRIIELSPKTNVAIVLPLTDNRISSKASLPDSIYTSMSGKTVEVNNTDAEGRLILADAITYAIKKFNPSRIVDIATLTGAMVVSLGSTFTGAWATTDNAWEDLQEASRKQNELVWRMPFHNDFLINIKKSNFADYKNTDLSGKGGSCSAAMFLKEFTENKEYIHLDIAGSSMDGEDPNGIMVKTLVQLALDAKA